MAEYIEREAVEKFIEDGLNNQDVAKRFGHDAIEIMAEVHYMPAADVAPVSHEQWVCVHKIDPISGYRCSKCRRRVGFDLTPYCPNCGAKMDGGDNDEAD